VCFFFQAEDGIRDYKVTGVQTCALPIFVGTSRTRPPVLAEGGCGHLLRGLLRRPCPRLRQGGRTGPARAYECVVLRDEPGPGAEIGRASCRERVERTAGPGREKNANQGP